MDCSPGSLPAMAECCQLAFCAGCLHLDTVVSGIALDRMLVGQDACRGSLDSLPCQVEDFCRQLMLKHRLYVYLDMCGVKVESFITMGEMGSQRGKVLLD